MKNKLEIFEDGSPQTQRKKRLTFYTIWITLSLIAVMLIVLLIFGIATLIANNAQKTNNNSQAQISVSTTTTVLEENGIYSGTLLKLDATHRYTGELETVIIRNRESRPKTQGGANVYSILAQGTDNEYDLRATEDTIEAFNLMLKDFYNAKSDDNLCIKTALTLASADTVDPIFSAGTALELSYYFDYNADPTDIRSIFGVEKYSWIYNNAYKYGFINVKLPSADGGNDSPSPSSIFRYVGIPHATYMKTKTLDLDAYLEQLRSATPDAPILIKIGKDTFASYFVSAAGEHTVPAEHEYTVSGNNYDGYVITAKIVTSTANTKK